jgi:eukaryotic translation initiation factor 2C
LEPNDPLSVTFIVVQKRHHVRFFPMNPKDADRNGNVLPGTVVDKAITSPHEWDFYLNSHGSLQGTSKPTHYFVLHDDSKFSADQVQNFCYHFCHTFCRATRTVSLVPPAYYADLLAYRARFHSKGGFSDTMSVSEQSDVSASAFERVQPAVEATMYFV